MYSKFMALIPESREFEQNAETFLDQIAALTIHHLPR